MSKKFSNIKLITSVCIITFLGFATKYWWDNFREQQHQKEIELAKKSKALLNEANSRIPKYIDLLCFPEDKTCIDQLSDNLKVDETNLIMNNYSVSTSDMERWHRFIYNYHLSHYMAYTHALKEISPSLYCTIAVEPDLEECKTLMPKELKEKVFRGHPYCLKYAFKKYPHWKPLDEWTDKEMLEIPLLPKHEGYWQSMDTLAFEYLRKSPDTFCQSIMYKVRN